MIELANVQKTLLLPLWGRAVESRKQHPLLVDKTAARIIETIDFDFSTIARNISPITQLAWIARSLHTDRTIREFLERDPDATVVNLGCGLDTTFERVDNGRLRWYNVDFPDVIELRESLIPEGEREHSVGCSMLEEGWVKQVDASHPVFFVGAGLFYFLSEPQVRAVFTSLADAFPGAEVLFDACSPRGLKFANRKVIRAGGMDESAMLKWSLRAARDLEAWDSRIAVLEEYPVFRNLKRGLSLKEKWGTTLVDILGVMSMVHLRLGGC